ncbi:MAG: DNA replication/repair protein RecF [Clostridia bacterium]|nr:DNA replication/repair protein RecF [Clostridia bacterium]
MYLKTIDLTNYRGYERTHLDFPDGITVISGKNAQGKTNLLESVFFCCSGKSHRNAKEDEIILFGAEYSILKAVFERNHVAHDVEITLQREKRKKILFDGARISRTSEFVGQMKSVLFSPDNILIVKDSPARRRNYMDVALSQVFRGYLKLLIDYNKTLAMRNALLKEGPGHSGWKTMDVFESQLAHYGARIMAARRNFCEEAGKEAETIQNRISGGEDTLTVTYSPNVESEATEEENRLLEEIGRNREKDIFRRTTTVGPHRDDILLLVNGKDAKSYASQGQQRTAALSIKMAELSFMRKYTGENPILLLDDVFGELDAKRRQQLLTAVDDCQVILTCTNIDSLPIDQRRIQAHFDVENGVISPARNRQKTL